VLEHVKRLSDFIEFSARYVSRGGLVMHRYDLGHALHPHNFRAWFHVQLGNYVPWTLPERQFVRYVPESEVIALYKKFGITHTETTYHQMLGHKEIEKVKTPHVEKQAEAVATIFAWEQSNQDLFRAMSLRDREYYLPAIAVYGQKV
jgi:hypothetical protein